MIKVFLTICSLWLLSPALLVAQSDNSRVQITFRVVESPRQFFSHDAFVFAAPQHDKAVIRVIADFVNDLLQFKDYGDAYVANYEMVIDLFDARGNRVDGIIDKNQIVAKNFEETNSRKHLNRYQVDFSQAAGAYTLYLEVQDLITKRKIRRQSTISVPDFSDSLSMSDVAVIDHIQFDKAMLPAQPNITRVLQDAESDFVAYCEFYSSLSDSIRLDYRIYDEEGYRLISITEYMTPEQGTIRKLVPLKELTIFPGRYLLIVEARVAGLKTGARKSFRIQYWEPPKSLTEESEYPSEVLALKHVSKSKEFSQILTADDSERAELIRAFWSKRDPTPDTDRNELQEEFRARVKHTVKHFSNITLNQHGPDTDRGKIYIIYGPPTEISKNSLPANNRTYEIWYYKEIDKRFIFVDKSGFGIFKLIHQD